MNPASEVLWSSDGELNVAPGPNPAFEMDLPIIAVIDLPLNRRALHDAGRRSMGRRRGGEAARQLRAAPVVMPPPAGMFS